MDQAAPAFKSFYASPLGLEVTAALAGRIKAWWPSLDNLRVLTLGYGLPLDQALLQQKPLSLSHLSPARFGDQLERTTGRTLIADDAFLPFEDASLDRIILLHRLEHARRQDRTLRDIWRVLKPGGEIIVVVPSAFGLWARVPSTPFASGEAFTGLALASRLGEQLFRYERMRNALYFPPAYRAKWARTPTGGVILAEAQKLGGPATLLQSQKPALHHSVTPQAARQERSAREHGPDQTS